MEKSSNKKANIFLRIQKVLTSFFVSDPNALVLVEWIDLDGKIKQEVMPAGMADDISETLFGKRTFGTKKGCEFNTVNNDPNNYKGVNFSNHIRFNFQLVDKPKSEIALEMTDAQLEEKISNQYQARIDFLLKSNKPKDIVDAEIAKLLANCTFDPRRPSVSYTSKSQAERSIKVQEVLNALTDEEFLTDSYVLNWHDLLNS